MDLHKHVSKFRKREGKIVNKEQLHLIECPICFHQLTPPVFTCVNGHGVCHNCKNKLLYCGICRERFSPNQNTLLNQLVESVVVQCRYKENRCKRKDSMINSTEHEKVCSLKTIYCCDCSVKMSPLVLNKHFDEHKKLIQFGWLSLSEPFDFEFSFDTSDYYFALFYFEDVETHFLMRYKTDKDDNSILFCIQYCNSSTRRMYRENYMYSLKIDQKLSSRSPCFFTCNGICVPYFDDKEKINQHSKVVKLDLKSIFFDSKYLSSQFIKVELEIKKNP